MRRFALRLRRLMRGPNARVAGAGKVGRHGDWRRSRRPGTADVALQAGGIVKVSVIVPTFAGGASYAPSTAFWPSGADLELIVVDDGSATGRPRRWPVRRP